MFRATADAENASASAITNVEMKPILFRLSSPFGGDSSVRERDLDAGAAEVDHRDQGVGGVEPVGARG
jgi:hypothetical protein